MNRYDLEYEETITLGACPYFRNRKFQFYGEVLDVEVKQIVLFKEVWEVLADSNRLRAEWLRQVCTDEFWSGLEARALAHFNKKYAFTRTCQSDLESAIRRIC